MSKSRNGTSSSGNGMMLHSSLLLSELSDELRERLSGVSSGDEALEVAVDDIVLGFHTPAFFKSFSVVACPSFFLVLKRSISFR